MFEPTSRYASIQDATLTVLDLNGQPRVVVYKRRRFIPSAGGSTTLVEHTVVQAERLDNITARYLGDPTQFWRVCDGNTILRAEELTEEVGRAIKITLPRL